VAKHWAVDEIWIESAQVVETSGSTAGLRAVEVRSVRVDAQDHVGRLVYQAAIGVGLGITQEAEGGFPGGLSRRRLVGGEEADGRKESSINSTGIVEEGPHDDLDSARVGRGKGWGVVDRGNLGGRGTKNRGDIHARGLASGKVLHVQANKEVRNVRGIG